VIGFTHPTGKERFDDRPLRPRIYIGRGWGALHAPTRPARQLACCLRRTLNKGSDLVEWHRKHVVQDERNPLRRRESLQHDLQRHTNCIREQRFVFGILPDRRRDERLENETLKGFLSMS